MRTGDDVYAKWMGLNAFDITCGASEFMIDPYVSRDRARVHVPSEAEKYLTGCPKFILMTHSHWDHLGDAPSLIARTGAVLYASRTSCNIMRHFGVEERFLHEIRPGDRFELAGINVTVFESRHMEPCTQTFYEEVPDKMEGPGDWRCGEVFAFLVECGGLRIFNAGSANLHLPAVDGLECDYFLCGISRWKPGFPELISHIRFKRLIPTHHDLYTQPLSQFVLRDDYERLREAVPGLPGMELEVLKPTLLPPLD